MQVVKETVVGQRKGHEIKVTTFKQSDGTFCDLKHISLFPTQGAKDAR